MRITKQIEVRLNIDDPIGLYVDFEANLMRILQQRYEGKCYAECYIVSVDKIVQVSDCMIHQDGLASTGIISVIFLVSALVYTPGEIIYGCTVTQNDQHNMITCASEYAKIYIITTELFASLSVGQRIPVRVGSTRYSLFSDTISVNASHYLPTKTSIAYRWAPLRVQMRGVFADRLAYIEELAGDVEKLRKDPATAPGVAFFAKQLYAHNDVPKVAPQPPQGATSVPVVGLITVGEDSGYEYIVQDNHILPCSGQVHAYKGGAEIPVGAELVDGALSPEDVISALLRHYIEQLEFTKNMTEIYKEKRVVADHMNLWAIYRKHKQ